MIAERIEVSQGGQSEVTSIWKLTFNRAGRLNALNHQVLTLFDEALEKIKKDISCRVLVLSGQGRAFCAGFDMGASAVDLDATTSHDSVASRRLASQWRSLVMKLDSIPGVVTIAALHGNVVGGGAVLSCACDIRLVVEDTCFILPEMNMGLPLFWGGSALLAREVGLSRARRWILLCQKPVPLQELASSGFARIVSQTELGHKKSIGEFALGVAEELVRSTAAVSLAFTADQLRALSDSVLGVRAASCFDGELLSLYASQNSVQQHVMRYISGRRMKSRAKL